MFPLKRVVQCIPHKSGSALLTKNTATEVLSKDPFVPRTSLRRVDGGEYTVRIVGDDNHDEGSTVAIVVVARPCGCGAEHRGFPIPFVAEPRRLGQHQIFLRHGIPDDEPRYVEDNTKHDRGVAEEDAAVARVLRAQAALDGAARAERGRGDEAGGEAVAAPGVAEEAEHGGRAVEGDEPAAEGGVGDQAAPPLAGDGGAREARGVGRRQAEEDLLHDLVRQRCGWRRTHRLGGGRRSKGLVGPGDGGMQIYQGGRAVRRGLIFG